MTLQEFKQKLTSQPENVEFTEVMQVVEDLYSFAPTSFKNGELTNNSDQNNGSCKLFAFAKDQDFNKEETLSCFGAYYRKDVLKHPDAADHQNIRNFMKFGWDGVKFTDNPLQKK